MHPQLENLVHEFEAASARLRALHQKLAPDVWRRRPSPESWSPGECVAHLNLTSAAMIPLIRQGLVEARELGGSVPSRYRRDVIGWLLLQGAGSSPRLKVKTTAPFVPTGNRPVDEVMAEFERLQADQIACVREADGLPIHRVKMVSPFNAKLRYNVFAALSILPRHQQRHLAQAERAASIPLA